MFDVVPDLQNLSISLLCYYVVVQYLYVDVVHVNGPAKGVSCLSVCCPTRVFPSSFSFHRWLFFLRRILYNEHAPLLRAVEVVVTDAALL